MFHISYSLFDLVIIPQQQFIQNIDFSQKLKRASMFPCYQSQYDLNVSTSSSLWPSLSLTLNKSCYTPKMFSFAGFWFFFFYKGQKYLQLQTAFCRISKSFQESQTITSLPDFHGNFPCHPSVILDWRLSLPCLPSVPSIWRFVLDLNKREREKKISLLGGGMGAQSWQSTKQIPSTCLCKLFMLLMHYASAMRHTQIKQLCLMFCLHVSK